AAEFKGDRTEAPPPLTASDYVHTWLSNGDGAFDVRFFRPWVNYGIQAGSWLSGDFNGDGKGDLVHLTASDYVNTWLSNGNGTFNVGFFRPWPNYGIQAGIGYAGAFNGDGMGAWLHRPD